MSRAQKQEVTCPNCGSSITFTYWESINTMIPTAISDIITGKLFDVQCEKCGYETRVDYPILFNDMEHKVMIYYIRPDDMPEIEKTVSVMRMTGVQVRIVTSQNELREKAMIFNSGFDDRVIEVIKVITLAQLQEQLQGRNVDAVYFDNHDDTYFFDLILDGQQASVNMDIESVKAFSDQISNKFDDKCQDYIIDQAWAQHFIESFGS